MEYTGEITMEDLMEIVAEYYIFAPHEREIRQMAKRLIAEFRDRKKLLDSVI